MSDSVNLIFPHQLFKSSELLENQQPIYLIEEHLFFRQYPFHKQKLVYHRASMQAYLTHLQTMTNTEIIYIEATEERCDIRVLMKTSGEEGVKHIHYIDPCDDWLQKRLHKTAQVAGISLHEYHNPSFLNTKAELSSFSNLGRKSSFKHLFIKSNAQPGIFYWKRAINRWVVNGLLMLKIGKSTLRTSNLQRSISRR